MLLIALPWLNPFASGPAPAVVPLLVSWACAALLLGMAGFSALRVNREQWVAGIAHAWLAAALLSSGMGLLQYFGLVQHLAPWVSTGTMGEAFANLRQRNQFATLTSIGLAALLWQVAQAVARAPSIASAIQWLMWVAAALLLAAGNAASGSRTGLFQWWLLVGFGLVWWVQVRRQSTDTRSPATRFVATAVFALVSYLLCLWLLPWMLWVTTGVESGGLLGRFKEEVGCSSRRILWANVVHLIAQKPWLGWGWNELSFAHFVTLYPGGRFCDILDNAHNLPLHLAVELGVPLAAAACALLVWLVWRARPWQPGNPTRQLAWGVLAVIGLHSLVEYPLWYGPFQMAAGLGVWLLWTTPDAAYQTPDVHPQGQSLSILTSVDPAVYRYIAIFLIAFLTFLTWSYWRVSLLYLAKAERASAYQEDTMAKVRGTWLFQNQVQFAELTTAALTADNAAYVYSQALQLLHFSPEPRVAEKLIESAVLLGRNDEAAYYLQRYKAAFPKQHANWATQSPRLGSP